MRQYETLFITTQDYQNQLFTTLWKKLEKIITKDEGKVVNFQNFGKKKLAYPIKKTTRGSFYNFNFVSAPEAVREIENLLNLEENILRYQTNVVNREVDLTTLKIEYTGNIFINDKETDDAK